MIPGDEIRLSTAEIPASLTHFRAFVDTVSKHIDARMVENKLCINRAKDRENMNNARREWRSLLQFVHWPLFMSNEYLVSPMTDNRGYSPSCRISSPWIDFIVDRGEKHPSDRSDQKPVPQILAIVRWNERQLLADQAVLTGVKNVPLSKAMPLSPRELGHFINEYEHAELLGKAAAKPIEERIPADLLWLLRRSRQSSPFTNAVQDAMYKATEKGGNTKLVLALIDRCFASPASDRLGIRYSGIIDITDPILLNQYRVDMRPLR
jgi:hypothetical protein